MEMTKKEEKKSELEIELEQTIDFLRKRMSEYEFEYNKQLRDIKFLEEENKKLKENYAKLDKVAGENVRTLDELEAKRIELEEENKKLNEYIKELEDELWVRKHSYKKLMKDKELYERARDVMFGSEEEDLYEDVK